jgi:hypothetical protein
MLRFVRPLYYYRLWAVVALVLMAGYIRKYSGDAWDGNPATSQGCTSFRSQAECNHPLCIWETRTEPGGNSACIHWRAKYVRDSCGTEHALPGDPGFKFDVVFLWINRTLLFGCEYELQYGIRSLERFHAMKHVGNIYVLYSDTHIYDGSHVDPPAYLRHNHSRIRFVPQSEVFFDKENLPAKDREQVWNVIHRIPGLSEFYLTFEDDAFLGREWHWDDWWDAKTRQLIFHERSYRYKECLGFPSWTKENSYWTLVSNTDRLLTGAFGPRCRHMNDHFPIFYRKCVATALTDEIFPLETLETERGPKSKYPSLKYYMMVAAPNAAIDAGLAYGKQIDQHREILSQWLMDQQGKYEPDPVGFIQPGFSVSFNIQGPGAAAENTEPHHQAFHDEIMAKVEMMFPIPSECEIPAAEYTGLAPPDFVQSEWAAWCRRSKHFNTW